MFCCPGPVSWFIHTLTQIFRFQIFSLSHLIFQSKKSQHPKSSVKSPLNPSLTIPSLYRTRYRKSTVKLSNSTIHSNHFQIIFFTLPTSLSLKPIKFPPILPIHLPDHKNNENVITHPLSLSYFPYASISSKI